VIRKPTQEWLAGLLGVAIGVMATVSLVELVIRNALENDALLVCASTLAGGVAYYVLEPLFPKVDEEHLGKVCARHDKLVAHNYFTRWPHPLTGAN
jgi:ZIP family zinc transporter